MLALLLSLFLYQLSPVVGSSQPSSADLASLNNDKGATPCIVATALQNQCSPNNQTDEDPSSLPPIVQTNCTCNTVYYNLWCACALYSSTQAPTFTQWAQQCVTKPVNVTVNDYPRKSDTEVIDIPQWAYLSLTKNSTFDVDTAVKSTKHSNTARIVVPVVIVSVLLLAGIISVIFYQIRARSGRFYDWHHKNFRGVRRALGLLPAIPKVGSGKEQTGWAIEEFEPLDDSLYASERGQGRIRLNSAPNTPITSSSGTVSHERRTLANPLPRAGQRAGDSRVTTERGVGDGVPARYKRDGNPDGQALPLLSQRHGGGFSASTDSLDDEFKVTVAPPTGRASPITVPPSARSPSRTPRDRTFHRPSSSAENLTSAYSPSLYSQSLPFGSTDTLNTPSSRGLRNQLSLEDLALLRPARGDPTLLFPSAVRAAGYSGVSEYHGESAQKRSENA